MTDGPKKKMSADFFVKISTYILPFDFCRTEFLSNSIFCYYFNLNLENGGIFLKIENYNLSWKESAMIRSRRKTSLAKTGKQYTEKLVRWLHSIQVAYKEERSIDLF